MIKYYCDVCGKEVDKTPNDFQRLIVPDMYNGIVYNNEADWHMCNKCALKWWNCFKDFCKNNKEDKD